MSPRKRRKPFYLDGKVPQLGLVPAEIRRAAMPAIVKAGAEQIQQESPKRRGTGSPKSIVSRISPRVEQQGEKGIIAAKAPHSHLIYFGVKPHSLAGKKRKRGHVMKIRGDPGILRRDAWHPGIKANPFMDRGLDRAQGEIGRILAEEATKAFASTAKDVGSLIGDLGAIL